MREKIIAKPWSKQETDLFFLAISMVGTDFTTISQMFRHRQRVEIKNKFKKEERVNAWRLDQAFRERKHFDLDVFAKHLEKAHEEQKKTEDSINQPHNTKPSKKQKGDFAITKNAEADDPHVCCSCIDGEDDLSSQSPALTCEEESSLLLFTEESDYQSGLDLAGAESSSASQDECGKLSITPALLARGHFQRLKPNLKKATSRKGASEDKEVSSAPSTGNADGDTGVDFPGDDHSGKEENMKIPESGSSQYSCKSAIHSHSPSLTQDSTVSQDLLTEVTSISETQDIKSAIKPAPLPPGRVQTPKPYLAGRPERKAEIDVKESKNFEASVCNAEKRPATDQINSSGAENVPGNEAGAASLLAKNNEKSSVTGEDSLTLKKSDDDATPGTSVESTPAITNKEKNASDQKRHTLKPVVTRRRLQRPKPNLSKSVTRSAVIAPPVSVVQGDSVGSSISVEAEMLTDPESKSSEILDTYDGAAVTALAQPKEFVNDPEKGKVASLKPVYKRFPKPSPNLGRAVRKETSTTELSKTQDLPDTSTAGDVCKEAGHITVEKSASIQPAQLRRGRLIRPVPNLVKPSTKTLSPLNNKKNEDLNTAAADKSPTFSKWIHTRARCTLHQSNPFHSGYQDIMDLTDDPQSSSQTSSVQDLSSLQRSNVETVSHELLTVGQEDADPGLGLTSRKRSAQCMDDGDLPALPKKPSVSEQVTDPKIKGAAVEGDGNGKVAPEVSDTEPMPDVSPVGVAAVIAGPSNWPVARTTGIVPVEMPGISITDPLDINLPLAFANPRTTSKTTLKRPGRKPLGFLSLVCKEKQLKKAKENLKKKNLPKTKRRKLYPTVRSRQKESPDLTLENANDSDMPSSSAAEMQSTSTEQSLPSVSQIPDNQDTDLHSPAKSHDLAAEEEAAPVSEYFFSDIFMEVDDAI